MRPEEIDSFGFDYARPFIRALNKLGPTLQDGLEKTLRRLASDFQHPALHTKRVRGSRSSDIYEARLNRDYRLIFAMRSPICLLFVASHDKALTKAVLYDIMRRYASGAEPEPELIDELLEQPVGRATIAEILDM